MGVRGANGQALPPVRRRGSRNASWGCSAQCCAISLYKDPARELDFGRLLLGGPSLQPPPESVARLAHLSNGCARAWLLISGSAE